MTTERKLFLDLAKGADKMRSGAARPTALPMRKPSDWPCNMQRETIIAGNQATFITVAALTQATHRPEENGGQTTNGPIVLSTLNMGSRAAHMPPP